MKKRLLSIIIISSMLVSACSAADSADEMTSTEASTTQDDAATNASSGEVAEEELSVSELASGTPWINSDLKENVNEDTVTDPKDDFALYANKDWINANTIPDGYNVWSHYSERAKDVQDECLELLVDDTLESHEAELIQNLYNYYLDWDSRNEVGVSPLEDIATQILDLKTIDEVSEMLTADETRDELDGFVGFGISSDINDSTMNVLYVDTAGLLLGDSAEYSNRTEYGDIIYNYRHDIFVYLARRLGMDEDDAEEVFSEAIDFETLLSGSIKTSEEQMSSDYISSINNPMKFDEVCGLLSNYPLEDILTAEELKYDGTYIVTEPDYFAKLDEVYNDSNIQGIKADMYVNYLLGNASYLDEETYEYIIDTQNAYLGTSGRVSDEEAAYNVVSAYLPTALQLVYLDKYGSEEARQNVEDICQEVIDTYKEMLGENDWLSDETKSYAIAKLDTMKIHAAYPDKFRDMSGLDISDMSYYEAVSAISEFDTEYAIKSLGQPVNDDYWADGMNILECNAYYDPSANTINMIIGMMGEPFYSDDMSTEELYASMAAFWIGHEVSHAFDSNGAQYDADGNLNNWWTEEDLEEFNKRIAKLDDYLDTLVPFEGYSVTGSNVDTEMLADISGVQCALRMAAKIEDFDYAAFFTKYAQMNASIDLYSYDLMMLQQDEHPLNYLRTNVPVQQFDEFYEAFDVQEGDNMYLAPDSRVLVW
ncbi:MAG: M13 family metallopeptidase [Butyrivibrio sp.]|nr:M13 family metallopeptidase [Butyrivibrio sp.]